MVDASDETQKGVRHVRFAAEVDKDEHGDTKLKSKEETVVPNSKKTTPRYNPFEDLQEEKQLIPRRIEIKDPNSLFAIATVMIIFLFLISFCMDDGGAQQANMKAKAAAAVDAKAKSKVNQLAAVRDRFRDKLEESFSSVPRRAEDCSLYLAVTSLPGSQNFGIYAGTNLTEGANVLNIGTVAYAVDGNRNSESPLLSLSQYGFLLAHHHLLPNVQGGSLWTTEPNLNADSVLKASRSIHEGEELFLPFEEHPASVLGGSDNLFSFPLKSDFDLAQEIVRDEIDYLRPFRGKGQETKPDDGAFRLIRKTVEKLNKNAGRMLPVSTQELTTIDLQDTPLGLASMRNKSMEWLRRFGQCLDDTELKETDGSVTLVAKRQFTFGNIVLPVPLYITTASSSNSCSSSSETSDECNLWQQNFYKHCFGHDNTSLILCPLSLAVYATRSDDANVVFRWSPWNELNKEGHKQSVDNVIQSYSHSLTWDMVAVREIEPGEEIKIRVQSGSANFGGYITKDLLPAAWRQVN